MKNEIQTILEKQAAWQRSRSQRPWSQKLRDSVTMRRALVALKRPSSISHEKQSKQGPSKDNAHPIQ
ncbi:MAG: hypothetical protein M0036_07125 [Desulfobacteraceae bacterium]|nr:hypothetical protein [Desulfobacteraceae bacterium]